MNHLTSPGEATAEVTVAAMARAAIVGATCETAFQNSERRVVRCGHGPRCRTLTADRRGVPGVGTRAVGEARVLLRRGLCDGRRKAAAQRAGRQRRRRVACGPPVAWLLGAVVRSAARISTERALRVPGCHGALRPTG